MKKFLSAVCSVCLSFAFFSCSDFSTKETKASLTVTLPSKSSRSATNPGWTESISHYTVEIALSQNYITIENKNEKFFSETGNSGEPVVFEQIPEGEYSVTVLAKDDNEKVIGGGESTAMVREGETETVTVNISKYENYDNSDTDSDNTDSENTDTGNSDADNTGTGNSENEGQTDEKQDSEQESENTADSLIYDGKVSFNGTEYDTLAEALNVANVAGLASSSSVNTIQLTGNVKANLLTSSLTSVPWYVAGNLILDLNGYTLAWDDFTADSYNAAENPLLQVASGKSLLIKNGTITSANADYEHKNVLLGTVGGTIALSDLTIKKVKAPYILNIYQGAALYCDDVTVKDCEGLAQTVSYTYGGQSFSLGESLGIPINVYASEFYAKEMKIEDTLGANGLDAVLLNSNSSGAFVGGSISLECSASQTQNGSALSVIGSSIYLSSSVIFANSAYYGTPVAIVSGASINLADGFTFKTFDEDSFEALSTNNGEYITVENLGLTKSENLIAYGTSKSDSSSSSTALVLGGETTTGGTAENTGALYISGNSLIYGQVDMFYKSSIGQTGVITSGSSIKISFENVENYADSSINGDYPIFWCAGKDTDESNKTEAEKIPEHFEAANEGYTIQATDRRLQSSSEAQNGNTIYAPSK